MEALDLPHRNRANESPFCALMAGQSHSCSMCLQLQRQVEEAVRDGPRTLTCFAGLCESSVPIHVGGRLIGFLETGQVFVSAPSQGQLSQTLRQLVRAEATQHPDDVRNAYFQTPVFTPEAYEASLRLLAIFARHLSMLAEQFVVQAEAVGSPAIARARAYIAEHSSDYLPLEAVARAAHMSPYYFCKVFKQETGHTFTEYLARVRIEKADRLLRDPQRRISDVAFEVGFQSLSQFNRVFRSMAGESPSERREKLQHAKPPTGAEVA
ncbi:MAG TPA: helix-turn-helix domain-containing protein [Opitutaceae bacterium]